MADATEPSKPKIFSPEESNVMLERTGVNSAMWSMMTELAKQCIASNAFPAALKNPAQALVVMQAGVELGMKPMQAIQSMFFVNGKLSMYSSALLAMMKKNGLLVKWTKLSSEQVSGLFSAEGQEAVAISFGTEDAKRAGLSGNNYTKYPQDMYVARCVSRAAKLFPDLLGAPIETAEVMEDVVAAQVIDAPATARPVPAQLQTPQEKKEVKKAVKVAIAAMPDEERDAQFMADPEIASIVEEMQCSENENDFEGVRQMIVDHSWPVDKARYLSDKFVFYKDAKLSKPQEAVGADAAKEVFSAPSPVRKNRQQRHEELEKMKSVDLKPILAGYDIEFTGMDKTQRIGTILAWEFPDAIGQDTPRVTPPVDSPPPPQEEFAAEAVQEPVRNGVLGKLFGAK